MSKYTVNLLLFCCTFVVYCFSQYILFTTSISWLWIIGVIWISILLHYQFNTVHQASHFLLSKNKRVNACIGRIAAISTGITFEDFRTTHTLHHAFPSNATKDPDQWITNSGPLFTIPFKIWWHDYWFFSRGLWKKQHNMHWYICARTIQVIVISTLFLSGFGIHFLALWALPMLIVGTLNGIYLFYLPHYTHHLEKTVHSLPVVGKLFEFCAFASRTSHEAHHKKIHNNTAYFPFIYIISSKSLQ